MKKYILLLATLSGTCGIAYEILYTRMLSTYMGDMFYVAAATLAAFLLSLGVGSLIAGKWPKSLGYIEIAIGIYAFFASYIFMSHGEQVVTNLVNMPLPTPLILMSSVFIVLIIPAMMIGFSVPLFTLYAKKYGNKNEDDKHFGLVYLSYNIGAALCVLAIEYILLRSFGIGASTQFIALINIIIGLLILKITAPQKPKNLNLKITINNKVSALFFASFASGILQLFYLKLTGKIFGPFHENFAIILTSALLGIAIGSAIATLTKVNFKHMLLIAGISTAVIFSVLGEGIMLWAYLNETYMGPANLSWVLKIIMILLLSLLPFIFIGGAIPAFLKGSNDSVSAGKALAISSFGNCAGYLAMLFVIHQSLSDANIAVLITVILILSAVLINQTKILLMSFVIVLSIIYIPHFWPEKMLQMSFKNLSSTQRIALNIANFKSAKTYKGLDSTVDLITTQTDNTMYIINGYKSLSIGGDKKANLRELTFGMAPAMFSKKHDSALVLGLGTGITAAGTASIFKQVDVAEISPLVIDMLDVFKEDNFNISQKDHVNIQLQDGLIALMKSGKKYDAIINTVTSPAYFSSAKLYTTNFFKMAARRLNHDGVYSIWFDGRVSNKGLKIIFNSLKNAFSYCRSIHLTTSYNQMVCSNSKLKLHKHENWSNDLKDYFQNELFVPVSINEYLSSLVLKHSPRFPHKDIMTTEWDAPLNTFNNPTLEFDISKTLFNKYFAKNRRIFEYTDLNKSAYDNHILSPNELAKKCAVLTIMSMVNDTRCLEKSLIKPNSMNINLYLDLVTLHFAKHKLLTPLAYINDIINKSLSDNKLENVIPIMCSKNLSVIQQSLFQYEYTMALMRENKKMPIKLLNIMLRDGSSKNSQSLATDLLEAFKLPKMQKRIDPNYNPCKNN